jgi:hypothetical protein
MTTQVLHGKVQGGEIVLDQLLEIPDGTDVSVVVVVNPLAQEGQRHNVDFSKLPFFGMSADREDMKDSVAYVRRLREEEWQQRLTRSD